VDDAAQVGRDAGRHVVQRRDAGLGVLERQLGGAAPLEWRAAGEEMVEGGAERVEVAAGVGLLAAGDLGREVERGAEGRARHGQARIHPRALGEAEVGHLRQAPRREQDVRRLDVAVDDPRLVGHAERGGHLLHHGQRALRRQRPLATQHVRQALAVHKLHRDELEAAVLAHGVDLDDVGMDDCGGVACLAGEALDEGGVAREGPRQHLDGDEAVERGLARLVDRPHPPAAQQLDDLELAEALADQRIDPVGELRLAGQAEHGLAGGAQDALVNGGVELQPPAALRALARMFRHRFRPPSGTDHDHGVVGYLQRGRVYCARKGMSSSRRCAGAGRQRSAG